MPLAGSMKLKTFLTLVGGAGLLGAGAIGVAAANGAFTSDAPAVSAPVAPPTSRRKAQPVGPDKVVMAQLRKMGERALTGPKEKDALGAGKAKVNLYQDEGHASVNRLKVDWDRDDKWDEKWTFEDDGSITRQIAPEDDEVYSDTRTLGGPAAAETPVAAPVDAPEPGASGGIVGPGNAIQAFLLERQGKDLGTAKIKDASKGSAWKINLYQDDGHASLNRAKVDLDRDDKWDEKWTFADDGVSKQVAPADDENYTETWTFDGARWQKEG